MVGPPPIAGGCSGGAALPAINTGPLVTPPSLRLGGGGGFSTHPPGHCSSPAWGSGRGLVGRALWTDGSGCHFCSGGRRATAPRGTLTNDAGEGAWACGSCHEGRARGPLVWRPGARVALGGITVARSVVGGWVAGLGCCPWGCAAAAWKASQLLVVGAGFLGGIARALCRASLASRWSHFGARELQDILVTRRVLQDSAQQWSCDPKGSLLAAPFLGSSPLWVSRPQLRFLCPCY